MTFATVDASTPTRDNPKVHSGHYGSLLVVSILWVLTNVQPHIPPVQCQAEYLNSLQVLCVSSVHPSLSTNPRHPLISLPSPYVCFLQNVIRLKSHTAQPFQIGFIPLGTYIGRPMDHEEQTEGIGGEGQGAG